MSTPDALPTAWRDLAGVLDPYSPAAAQAWRTAAAELERALHSSANELLTLDDAAAESGYSKRRLRELVADGTIPQAGRKGAPRIRREDLPLRPGTTSPTTATSPDYDVDQDAGELVGRIG